MRITNVSLSAKTDGYSAMPNGEYEIIIRIYNSRDSNIGTTHIKFEQRNYKSYIGLGIWVWLFSLTASVY